MFALPVSGAQIAFRDTTGFDELFLAEAAADGPDTRIAVARRQTSPQAGHDWADLPYADVDPALLELRRRTLGDRLAVDLRCTGCGAPGAVSLSIMAYLADNRPRPPREARRTEDDGPGWTWRGLAFRVPLVRDVLGVTRSGGSAQAATDALAQACAPAADDTALARVGRLLDRIAPPLSREVRGTCPACGGPVHGWLDPGAVALGELQLRARALFSHVHLIASRYGWSEEAILSLPAGRRRLYVAQIEEDAS